MPATDGSKGWAKRNPEKTRDYKRDYVARNLAKVRAAAKARLLKKRKWIAAQKEARGCDDCKNKFPHYVLDFDHRPGTEKRGNICKMAHHGWPMLKAEVAKCDVVCANCHRIRTMRRMREVGEGNLVFTTA